MILSRTVVSCDGKVEHPDVHGILASCHPSPVIPSEGDAARLLVYNAARLRDQGRPFLAEAAMCKLFSSEVAERVTSPAVNLFGGYGFVKDYPVEKLYRDAKIGQIYEGTSNLQLQTIPKQLLD